MLQVVASWSGQISSEDGRIQIITVSLSNRKVGAAHWVTLFPCHETGSNNFHHPNEIP